MPSLTDRPFSMTLSATSPDAMPDTVDAWAALATMLDGLSADGRTVAMWWRDDDAKDPSPSLDRLLTLAGRHGVPVGLAVIPADTGPALAERVAASAEAVVLQHGWSHANHARDADKSVELGGERAVEVVLTELAAGRDKLQRLFGDRFLPVLVPPWNRIDGHLLPHVAGMGYPALSTFGQEAEGEAPMQVNVHIDPIAWRDDRRFVGESAFVTLCREAIARQPSGRPVGLMTHHWAHDEALWDVLDRLIGVLAGHDAVRWPQPAELFGTGPA